MFFHSDIDECLTNNGGCSAQATCINTPGSRVCQCNSGFNSSDGGVTCYTGNLKKLVGKRLCTVKVAGASAYNRK